MQEPALESWLGGISHWGRGLEPVLNNYNTNDAFYFGRGATYDPLTFFL